MSFLARGAQLGGPHRALCPSLPLGAPTIAPKSAEMERQEVPSASCPCDSAPGPPSPGWHPGEPPRERLFSMFAVCSQTLAFTILLVFIILKGLSLAAPVVLSRSSHPALTLFLQFRWVLLPVPRTSPLSQHTQSWSWGAGGPPPRWDHPLRVLTCRTPSSGACQEALPKSLQTHVRTCHLNPASRQPGPYRTARLCRA